MQEAIEKGAPVVFITGCSIGGIGAAVRSLKSMEGIIHPNILKLKVDVTSDESVKNAIDYIYSECGRLDILISNAGLPGIGEPGDIVLRGVARVTLYSLGPLLDASLDDVKKIMGTNYYGLIRLVNETIPRMAKRRFGLVVAIGSILGELGTPFTGLYNASKAALHAYTETLRNGMHATRR
ncbi:hypothetical protein MPER_02172 [Moniliophthora perniciosa FA553]|nr:hypothetical protein MPER_02172 [Moniliophthora perniciosa FA553]